MERRPLPIAHARHQSMLQRINVNVIHASLQIVVVAAGMLEKSPLPHALFVSIPATLGNSVAGTAGLEPSAGEQALDAPPTRRVVGIAARELPEDVQMIGQ